jgi:hypothetical protein
MMRHVIAWSALSYVPLLVGIGRAVFAVGHWTRSQGELLAVSGFLLGAAASALLFLPVLRLRASTRRFMGLSVTAYTVVSVSAAIVLALVLALIAVTIPLE